MDGIVLQHVSHILGIDEGIIDGDNLDVVASQDGPAMGEEWRQGSQTRVPTPTAMTAGDHRGRSRNRDQSSPVHEASNASVACGGITEASRPSNSRPNCDQQRQSQLSELVQYSLPLIPILIFPEALQVTVVLRDETAGLATVFMALSCILEEVGEARERIDENR